MSAIREKYHDLLAAKADGIKFLNWKPLVEDDVICGTIVSYDPAFMKKYPDEDDEPFPLIKIKTDYCVTNGKEQENGIFSVFARQKQLKEKIEILEHIPFTGDEIQIRYVETVKLKSGNSFKTFVVRHNPTRHDAARETTGPEEEAVREKAGNFPEADKKPKQFDLAGDDDVFNQALDSENRI